MKKRSRNLRHKSKPKVNRFIINPENTFELVDYETVEEETTYPTETGHTISGKRKP